MVYVIVCMIGTIVSFAAIWLEDEPNDLGEVIAVFAMSLGIWWIVLPAVALHRLMERITDEK